MALKTLSAKNAAALDKELMSTGAFSIDQLMELAGLSVSQAVFRLNPPNKARRILIACGPGNNGGDGLVAARHLWHYGYIPSIYYPKQSKNELYEIRYATLHFVFAQPQSRKIRAWSHDSQVLWSLLYCLLAIQFARAADLRRIQRLAIQLKSLNIPFVEDFPAALKETDHVVDAIFGFSFSGEIREPFPSVIEALEKTTKPILAVDAPSSWSIEDGPPTSGPGKDFRPAALISLTAPKPLVKFFKGRHFVGGRFVSPYIAKKYDLNLPEYSGLDQVVEVDGNGHRVQ